MQCPNCASQEFDLLENGAGRCRFCGQIIPGMGRPSPIRIERQYKNTVQKKSAKKKDKGVAVLLALFLGFFGVQFFYLRENTKGFVCLGITLLLANVYSLGIIITGIWSLIFIIQILTMSEQEFNIRYNNPKNDKK